MYSRIVLLAGVLVLPFAMKPSGDAPIDRATLKGLGAVGVVVDKIDPELMKQGLTEEVVRKQVEGRLHDAGIGVDPSAKEFVGVRLLEVRAGRGPYALCLSVGMFQPVVLSRNKDIRTATETWSVETILLAGPKVVSREALTSVDELADRLTTAYRNANPK